ncbi:hypothetical protein LZ318_26680 [Saccharopolyspora indica]|uniref:hypothetical protein n=1 Tax=Saccharopolyspora indica TaxID=1229659 RepID=UPI0022EA8CA2|nr:hypothetical protein [Saccharopolyspora indica]MDA3649033.1 hypothetical protein [Saccharopolyspora indica]
MDNRTKVRYALIWAGIAAAGAFGLAVLMIVFDMMAVGEMFRKCDMSGHGAGMSSWGVFLVTILLNLLLVPLAAVVFAGGLLVEVRLVIGKQWQKAAARGLVISVGVVVVLAVAVLASVLALGYGESHLPTDSSSIACGS